MQKIIFLLFLAMIYSCHPAPDSRNKIDYQNIPNQSGRANGVFSEITLDSFSIYMGGDNLTSMEGDFFIQKDTIYFGDQQLASIFMYDTAGRFLSSRLKRGKGPGEIFGLHTMTPLPEGYAIIDQQWNVYLFDRQWNKENQYRINWQTQKSYKALLDNPDPNERVIYEVEYTKNNLRPFGDKNLIFPIVTEHERYNSYGGENARHFYENSYTIAIMDIENGNIIKMLCNRSPVYSHYRYLPNFKYVFFDTFKDTLFYSFEADTLIYRMDINDTIPNVSFGLAAQGLNTKYTETRDLKEADENFASNRKTFGYYNYLTYISEKQILFKGFSTGTPLQKHGIQIYRNTRLIAEITVPDNFKVFGYSAPYYYATGKPDYNNDRMKIYRFKLNL